MKTPFIGRKSLHVSAVHAVSIFRWRCSKTLAWHYAYKNSINISLLISLLEDAWVKLFISLNIASRLEYPLRKKIFLREECRNYYCHLPVFLLNKRYLTISHATLHSHINITNDLSFEYLESICSKSNMSLLVRGCCGIVPIFSYNCNYVTAKLYKRTSYLLQALWKSTIQNKNGKQRNTLKSSNLAFSCLNHNHCLLYHRKFMITEFVMYVN